jgi:hypothetical protein
MSNMVEQRASHLNQLDKDLPEGLVVDAAWLEARGVSRSLRGYYVQSGWLDQPTRGLYRRSRNALNWQQVVLSIQNLLKLDLIVGGRTALELQGYAHYLSAEQREVYLYGPQKPPGWLAKLSLSQRFLYRNSVPLFRNDPITFGLKSLAVDSISGTGRDLSVFRGGDITTIEWGALDLPLTLSTPERAYLELLDELPQRESFHQADMLMQGAANLSPRRLQRLLTDCSSVKVKRLFFFFADRHQHAWLKRIDRSAIDLGKGKRMLVRGGKLDPVYQITVPGDLDGAV